ncbi:MAG TPA: hypothetical protein VIN08_00845 [Ohtaekwangia sp.]|uniref:hypothetical protein n=1 Tax=Ohtaekwangia sp. TaxID=2066019 RepID=UPI002F93B084
MKHLLILIALYGLGISPVAEADGWDVLAKVKFTEKLNKEDNSYYLYPFFDSRIRAYEGKDFELKGHYLPMDFDDARLIILSKFPSSTCFFCGGAGPASVVEVYMKTKPPRFKADQVITIKGTLQLNDKDIEHMNFILKDATLIK